MIFYRKALLCSTAISTFIASMAPTFAADPVIFTPVTVQERIAGGGAPSFMLGGSACISDNSDYSLILSAVTPLGASNLFGQVDGQLVINNDGDLSGSVAGHLFARDPGTGMAGIYAAYSTHESAGRKDGFRLGAEGELYLDRLTFSGLAGWDFGNDEVFGQARIAAYVTDNTKIYGGYAREGRDYGIVGAEHMFTPRASAFAEGWFASGSSAARVGLKFHFGGNYQNPENEPYTVAQSEVVPTPQQPAERTLISRDREEFVPLWMQPCADDTEQSEEPTTTLSPTVQPTETPTVVPTSTRPSKPTTTQPVVIEDENPAPPVEDPATTGLPPV